jgi:hypothetical protein
MVNVQLPVQLACNRCAASVSAGSCLHISKVHACTRAARLPHVIGSYCEGERWRIDLVMPAVGLRSGKFSWSICTLICRPPRSVSNLKLDHLSCSQLSIADASIDSTRVLPLTAWCNAAWEKHGKIDRSRNDIETMRERRSIPSGKHAYSQVVCRGGKISGFFLFDIIRHYSGSAFQNWRRPALENPARFGMPASRVFRLAHASACVGAVLHRVTGWPLSGLCKASGVRL